MNVRALVVLSVLAVGCGPTTVGDSCDLLGNTICGRCFPSEKSDCLVGFFSTCCVGTVCEMPVKNSGDVLRCNELLRSSACSSILQGNVPAICRNVASP